MLKKLISVALNTVFKPFPINNKKIVFLSTKYQATDNPYYVYKYLKEHFPDYKLIFIVSRDADLSGLENGDYAFVRTFKSFYHLATYKYLFTCQSLGSLIKKRKGQVYIQLWHGIPLKKMGLDVANPDNISQLPHTVDWDYLVSSGEFEAEKLKTSSGYTCATKFLGNPRTDALFYDYDIESIKYKLKLDKNKKTVLYAPTFRDAELKADVINIDLPKNLYKNFNLLIRLHPFVAEKINPEIFTDSVINVCDFANLNQLLAVSDILITDYSSIFFDFSLIDKLTVFYPYDFEDYIRERDGFYIDYKSNLPGPVAYNKTELSRIFEDTDKFITEYREKREVFNKKYSTMNDGNVCQRIAEELKNGGFDRQNSPSL